jgi:pimeloyl-ACP methyl ester carboxylesterase
MQAVSCVVRRLRLAGAATALVTACANHRSEEATQARPGTTAERTASATPIQMGQNDSARMLPPWAADLELVHLPVERFGKATVALPRGAVEPRPVVVALHGHAVRPEHACTRWSYAAHGWPFVLCPLGLPADASSDQAVTLGSANYTYREIEAGLKALRARYAPYLVDGRPVLAGWSQGAQVGAKVAQLKPRFDALVFGEGGYDILDDQAVARLAGGGVRRVLLLCGTKACERSYARALARFERAGVPCRVNGARGFEHPFDGAAVETARSAWPWLVEGDTRFR